MNSGFTLIELLAVIVILAVIALISTPLITNIIEKSRKNAFKESVNGILSAIEYDYMHTIETEETVTHKDYTFPDSGLDFKGDKPKGGWATIDKDGETAIAVYDDNEKWCVVKNKSEGQVRLLENYTKCDQELAENLFINGYGEYNDNTNLTYFNFKDKVFFQNFYTNMGWHASVDKIKIDPNNTYQISMTAKTTQPSAQVFIGVNSYDEYGKEIIAQTVYYIPNTLTTLTKDLKKGDQIVYLDNASNFKNSTADYQNGFIFWNYKNYAPETYSRNYYHNLFNPAGIDRSNHTITLIKPWDGPTMTKGTPLSQSNSGATYVYSLNNTNLSSEWQTYKVTMSGIELGSIYNKNRFRPGTHTISIVFNPNYGNSENGYDLTFSIKDIVIKKIVE